MQIIKTKTFLKSICTLGILLILGGYFYYSVIRFFIYRNNAQELILSIEKYKSQNGRYPLEKELSDFRNNQDNKPYYKYINPNKYIIYYGIGFDETYTYYSDKKEWKKSH